MAVDLTKITSNPQLMDYVQTNSLEDYRKFYFCFHHQDVVSEVLGIKLFEEYSIGYSGDGIKAPIKVEVFHRTPNTDPNLPYDYNYEIMEDNSERDSIISQMAQCINIDLDIDYQQNPNKINKQDIQLEVVFSPEFNDPIIIPARPHLEPEANYDLQLFQLYLSGLSQLTKNFVLDSRENIRTNSIPGYNIFNRLFLQEKALGNIPMWIAGPNTLFNKYKTRILENLGRITPELSNKPNYKYYIPLSDSQLAILKLNKPFIEKHVRPAQYLRSIFQTPPGVSYQWTMTPVTYYSAVHHHQPAVKSIQQFLLYLLSL